MTNVQRAIERIKRRPPDAAFEDVRLVLEHHDWRLQRRRGSHASFRRGKGDGTIVVPLVSGRTVKRVYLSMIIERLEL